MQGLDTLYRGEFTVDSGSVFIIMLLLLGLLEIEAFLTLLGDEEVTKLITYTISGIIVILGVHFKEKDTISSMIFNK